MFKRVLATLAVAVMLTVAGAQGAQAYTVEYEGKSGGGHKTAKDVDWGLTSVTIHWNRSESKNIMVTGSEVYAAAMVAAICTATVPTGPLGAAGCAAAATITVAVARSITLSFFNSHPNWCMHTKTPYIAGISAGAWWENCSTHVRIT